MPCEPIKLHGRRLLIVEDEALISMLMEDCLGDAGAKIIGSAITVAEALKIIENATLDGGLHAAVLDQNLVGELVTPVADRLTALGIPFLFATGYDKDHDMRGHNAAPVVRKPFNSEELVAAVEALMSLDNEKS